MKVKSYDIDRITNVRGIIDSDPAQRMTITELALEGEINSIKLQGGFHELFGKTIHQYRTDQRLARAISLMEETDLTIAEIAYRTGFNSRDVLTRVFKKKFYVSPRVWRKEQKDTVA